MRENSTPNPTPVELETLAADISTVLMNLVLDEKALSAAQEREMKAVIKNSLEDMEIGEIDVIAILEQLLLDEVAMDGLSGSGLHRANLSEFLEQIKASDGVLETAAGPQREGVPGLVMSEGAHFVDNSISSPLVGELDMENPVEYLQPLEDLSGLTRFAQRALDGEGLDEQVSNTPPVLDGAAVTPVTFKEGADFVPAFRGLKAADPDGDQLEGATIKNDNFQPGDELFLPEGYSLPAGVSWAYDPATGVGTLSGPASPEVYQDILQNILYRNTSENPDNYGEAPTRNLSVFVRDSEADSNTFVATVELEAVNDAPALGGMVPPLKSVYTEGDDPLKLFEGITVADPDSKALHKAIIELKNAQPDDELDFAEGYTLPSSMSYDFTTRTMPDGSEMQVLTLRGKASPEEYQEALRNIVYKNASKNPGDARRAFELEVFDADNAASDKYAGEIEVVPVNSPPELALSPRETRVNKSTDGDQINSQVAPLKDGGWVALWVNAVDGEAYGQRYNADGTLRGAEFPVSQGEEAASANMSVIGLEDGGWVAVWQIGDNKDMDIRARIYNADGSTRGGPFTVNSLDLIHQIPSVAALDNGGWVAIWMGTVRTDPADSDTETIDIYARLFDRDGNPQGPEFVVNTTLPEAQVFPNVIALADGTWIVIWNTAASVSELSPSIVRGQRFNADGTPNGSEFTVLESIGSWGQQLALTPLEGGGWVTSWHEGGDVYARIFEDDGTPRGEPFLVNDAYTAGAQRHGEITGLKNGNWIATWTSEREDGSGPDVYGQAYDRNGNKVGEMFRVHNTTTENNQQSSIIALDDGGWVVVWTGTDQAAADSGKDLYMQRYDANGVPINMATYTEGGAAVTVFDTLDLTDIDDENIENATVRIGDVQPGDQLAFRDGYTLPAGMSWSYDPATGIGTLSGSASKADYQEALRNIAYRNTSENPDNYGANTGRSITAEVSDGEGNSNSVTATVGVTSVNQAPVLDNSAGDGRETPTDDVPQARTVLKDGGWITTWDSGGEVYGRAYNADGTPRGSAFRANTRTVQHQSGARGAALEDGGWIIAWQSNGADRSSYAVRFQRYDAEGRKVGVEREANSYTYDRQLNPSVIGLPDGGWVIVWNSLGQDGSGYGIYGQRYNANDSQQGGEFRVNTTTAGDQRYPTVTELDDSGWVVTWRGPGGTYGRIYKPDGNPLGDEFHITNTVTTDVNAVPLKDGGWVAVWSANDSDGKGVYGQLFAADGSKIGGPIPLNVITAGNQTGVTVKALDDGGWVATWDNAGVPYSRTFNADGTPRPPVTFIEGEDAVPVFDKVDLSDVDDLNMESATVRITDFQPGDELVLADGYSLPEGMSWSYDPATGIGTLSGSGSKADYQEALRNIAYRSSSENPDNYGTDTVRTITAQVTDGEGNSNTVTSDVGVEGVNQAPVLENPGQPGVLYEAKSAQAPTGGGKPPLDDVLSNSPAFGPDTPLDAASLQGDNANNTLTRITGKIWLEAGKTYQFRESVDDVARLTLNGQEVLNDNVSNQSTTGSFTPAQSGYYDFEFLAMDWQGNGDYLLQYREEGETGWQPIAARPGVAGETYTEGGSVVPVLGGIVLNDPDSDMMDGATIRIEDFREGDALTLLGYTLPAGMSWRYDLDTGIATLSGAASVADYQEALRNIKYRSSSDNPDNYGSNPSRTILAEVNDGNGNSNTVTGYVNIAPVNEVPVLDNSGASAVEYTEGGAAAPVLGSVDLSDVDSRNMDGATVRITDVQPGDTLVLAEGYSLPAGMSWSYDPATGIGTLSGPGSAADYQEALRNIAYQSSSENPDNYGTDTARTITTVVNDGTGDSEPLTSNVGVKGVNQAPVLDNSAGADPASRIDDNVNGIQSDPSVTGMPDGGYVTTWVSRGQDGSGYGVYGRRYDADGLAQGEPFRVNSTTSGDQYNAYSVGLKDGGWVTVWTSASSILSSNNDLYGQMYNADGSPQGGQFLVTSKTSYHFRTVALEDGGWIAVWSTDGDIYSQRYDADGNEIGGEPRVNAYTAGNQLYPDVTGLPNGGYVITWASAGQDGSGYGVYGRAYGADGQPIVNEPYTDASGQFLVNTTTAGDQRMPGVTELADGGWVVVWIAPNGVYGRIYDADGKPADDEFRISDNVYATPLDVTLLKDGSWVAVWTAANDGSGRGIYGQHYTAEGERIGDPFLINTITAGDQYRGRVTALEDGGWVVVWGDGSSNVYSRVYNADGTPRASVSYTEGAAAVPVFDQVDLSDVDDQNLESATVRITDVQPGDELVFKDGYTLPAGMSWSYDPDTGVGTLSGAGSKADYQEALRNIAYQSKSDNPDNNGTDTWRTITAEVTDGEGNSNTVTSDVGIAPTNDAPVLDTAGVREGDYTEGNPPAVLLDGIVLSDPDSDMMDGATIRIEDFQEGDALTLLGYTLPAGMSWRYDLDTGIATLSGVASVADYQEALRNIKYRNNFDNPDNYGNNPERTIVTQVNDGTYNSLPVRTKIGVTGENDKAVLDTSAVAEGDYTEGGTPAVLLGGIVLSDPDSSTMDGATVRIGEGFQPGDELVLKDGYSLPAGMSWNYDPATGIGTLSGSGSVDDYQEALRNIAYQSKSDNPDDFGSNPERTITTQVNDGSENSDPVSTKVKVKGTDDPSVIDTSGVKSADYTENGTPVAPFDGAVLSDPDNRVEALLVFVDNPQPGDAMDLAPGYTLPDGFSIVRNDDVDGTAGPSIGIINNSGAPAEVYQEILQNIVYYSTSENPDAYGTEPTRTIKARFDNDDDENSDTVSTTLTVKAVNDAPVLQTPGQPGVLYEAKSAQAPTGGGKPPLDDVLSNSPAFGPDTPLDAASLQGDNANNTLTRITGKIWLEAGKTYQFRESVDDVARLTLNGQEVLNDNVSNQSTTGSFTPAQSGYYDFKFLAMDWQGNGDYLLQYREEGETGWQPIVARSEVAATENFTEDGEAVAILPDATLSDVDDENIESATVQITEGFLKDSDELVLADGYTLPAGMSWSYDPATGVGTLSGSGSKADYQEALRNILYRSTSDNPDNSGSNPERKITTQINDGEDNSNTLTSTIKVVSVNDAPVLNNPVGDGRETPTDDVPKAPNVLKDGGRIEAWDSGGEIYGQAYNADGTPQGGQFRANSRTLWHQSGGTAAALEDGGWIIAWQSNHADGDSYAVHYQRYDADGNRVGDELRANTYTTNRQLNPDVAGLPDGGYVIVWNSLGQDGSGYGVYGRVYNADGSARGDEFRINNTTAGDQQSPFVSALDDSGWVATWRGPDGIYGRIYKPDGNPLSNEFHITNTVTNASVADAVPLKDGGWVAVWSADDSDGKGVYGQLYAADGTKIGDPIPLNVITAGDQTGVTVKVLADGGWVATWDNAGEAYSRTFNADGTPRYPVTFVEGADAVPVFDSVELSDADSDTMQGATVKITGGFLKGSDELVLADGYSLPAGMSWSYDPETGIGTLSGAGSKADYQEALRNIQYRNSSDNPDNYGNDPEREITTEITDGSNNSDALVSKIVVYDINTPPVLTLPDQPDTETRANTHTGDFQGGSDVSKLADGGWVTVWQSRGQDGDGWGAYGQRFGADGNPVGDEFRVDSTTSGDQDHVHVAGIKNGGWVVAWDSGGDIYAQAYNADGTPQGGQFLVNSETVTHQSGAKITALEDGGWVIAWQSLSVDGDRYAVRYQRYNADGQKVGGEQQANDYTASDQWYPDLAGLSNGGYVITWVSRGQDGDGFGVYSKLYDKDGREIRSEVRANTTTAGDQEVPAVTALDDGGYVITWQGPDGIYGRVYKADGNPLSDEFRIADGGLRSDVTLLKDGSWIAVWDADGEIYGQRYTAQGDRIGERFQLNTTTEGAQNLPAITALGDGGWVATWNSDGDVRSQVFYPDGSPRSSINYKQGGDAVTVFGDVELSDVDNQSMDSATVRINDFRSGDELLLPVGYTLPEGMSWSYDPATGIGTLSGPGSAADYQEALRNIQYRSRSDDPDAGGTDSTRTIVMQVGDGADGSNTAARVVGVQAFEAPELTMKTPDDPINYTENSDHVAVFPEASLTDANSESMISAMIWIDDFRPGDILHAKFLPPTMSFTYDQATGVGVLNGYGSVADYQEALRNITYHSTSDNPDDFGNDPERTIKATVNDGSENSNTITSTVGIIPVNDPPVVTLDDPLPETRSAQPALQLSDLLDQQDGEEDAKLLDDFLQAEQKRVETTTEPAAPQSPEREGADFNSVTLENRDQDEQSLINQNL
ncbi:hypothetical protein [Kiloniella sp. b19]|uniref:hypothetical protein n=1 Tax=Kiloniella sp. GXU_MW_B19 TaxID=3141326 RepID=UPI0031D9D441